MRKQGSKNKVTEAKYKNFILKVFQLTTQGEDFEMKQLVDSFQVSGNLPTVMQKLGLIKRTGKRGQTSYTWIGEMPNGLIVSEVIFAIRKKQSDVNNKRKNSLKIEKALSSLCSYQVERLTEENEQLKREKKKLILFCFIVTFFFALTLILHII